MPSRQGGSPAWRLALARLVCVLCLALLGPRSDAASVVHLRGVSEFPNAALGASTGFGESHAVSCAEFHPSRYPVAEWEDAVLGMKAGQAESKPSDGKVVDVDTDQKSFLRYEDASGWGETKLELDADADTDVATVALVHDFDASASNRVDFKATSAGNYTGRFKFDDLDIRITDAMTIPEAVITIEGFGGYAKKEHSH